MKHTDEFRIRLSGYKCVYCGEVASSEDHYPPRSISIRGMILPCCLECNTSLGARHPFSFVDRCRLAKDNIRRKYKKVLKMPHWDEEELSEMSYAMRIDIESCKRVRKIVEERLAWNAMSYISSLGSEKDFVAIIAECDSIINTEKPSWTRTEGFTVRKDYDKEEEFMENFN